jgi:predicted small lipoprotein YifL
MRAVFSLLLVAAHLAGCGYKGPLFLPETKAKAGKPATVVMPEPAPQRPVPSEAAPPPK